MEGVVIMLDSAFWNGRRILLTGHTGFKGSWMTMWLHRLGATISGISLPPVTDPNLFDIADVSQLSENFLFDIRETEKINTIVKKVKPEIVFHLAAQPLVRYSYKNPLETFLVNAMGTANLLEAIRLVDSVKVGVIITTDKVYHNREWFWPYRENDRLGGMDPYSASKATVEIITESYRDSFLSVNGTAIATARAGNVIGGGDWSSDRLVPDAVRAWSSGKVLEIRMPNAVRPWQHVLEPIYGYLLLAEKLWSNPELAAAYNFGPEASSGTASVIDVVEIARSSYGCGMISVGNENTGPHEAGKLSLDISRVKNIIGWNPKWDLEKAVRRTMNWYRQHNNGCSARNLCELDINEYEGINESFELC